MPEAHFITDTAHPGAWNMAFDEMLLQKVRTDPGLVFFRVYTWQPRCFTIGYSQRLGTELDRERCRSAGCDIVRRPTGGRTVLHAGEFAFTCVCSPAGFKERKDWSLTLGNLFITVLAELGVKAELVDTGAPPPFTRHAPSLCFTSSAQYEVLVDGRKIIGRSFRDKGDFRLEQGFFLLDDTYLRLPDFVPGLTPDEKEEMVDEIRDKTVSLKEAADRQVPAEEVTVLLRKNINRTFDMQFSDHALSEDDIRRTETLVTEKYGNPVWTERF